MDTAVSDWRWVWSDPVIAKSTCSGRLNVTFIRPGDRCLRPGAGDLAACRGRGAERGVRELGDALGEADPGAEAQVADRRLR